MRPSLSEATPYELLEVLGRGSMGVVHRARQKDLDREVAFKFIDSSGEINPDSIARFKREARALSRLAHPNVVAVYDTGTLEGQSYIAMELVHGQTLEAAILRDPLALRRQGDEVFGQILSGVAAIHGHGLIHRDLKPSNIMLTSDGRAVVMDLGLVKDATGNGTMLTQLGSLVGTPKYLAPEILDGEAASFSSDVWALGCIYFHIHSGEAPFRGDSMGELAARILAAELPDLEKECPDLSPEGRRFLEKLVARDPRRRPRDARVAASVFESRQQLRPRTSRTSIKIPDPNPAAPAEIKPRGPLSIGLALAVVCLAAFGFARVRGNEAVARHGVPSPSSRQSIEAPRPPPPDLLDALAPLQPGTLLLQLDRDLGVSDAPGARVLSRLDTRRAWTVRVADLVSRTGLKSLCSAVRQGNLLWPTTPDRIIALHHKVSDLRQLFDRLRPLGVDPGVNELVLFPPQYRPVEAPPDSSGDTYHMPYDPKYEPGLRPSDRVIQLQSAKVEDIHLRASSSRVIDAALLGALDRVEQQSAESLMQWYFVEPNPLALRPARADEVVFVTLGSKYMGTGKRVTLYLSARRDRWIRPVAIFSSPLTNSHVDMHYVLPASLFDGLRYFRIELSQIESMPFGEVLVSSLLFRFRPLSDAAAALTKVRAPAELR